MKIFNIQDMVGGWFVGNFDPSAYKTDACEVSYKLHKKDETWDVHYHKIATEINYLVSGKMTINGEHLATGDVFVIYPNETAAPVFLEDCHIVCVKTPGVRNDKYVVK